MTAYLESRCLRRMLGLAAACFLAANPRAQALDIRFDYSRDTSGFFAEGTDGRRILESAALFYELVLQDSLGALAPLGASTFSIDFVDPVTRLLVEVVPLPIPANTVIVYVGETDLPGSQIGAGWHGGIIPFGTDAYNDYVDTRGQSGIVYGAGAHEVAPWGGSVTVDSRDERGAARQWDYSLGVRPAGSGLHLYSLVIHELAHVLGFGICDAWKARVNGNGRFTGRLSAAEFGGQVPLDPSRSHWAQGTISTVYGTTVTQETAMDPLLAADSVTYATTLDMAGLADIGWEVGPALPAPVPPAVGMAMLPGGGSPILAWQGSLQQQYTLLETSDFMGWRASGPTLPGRAGFMQVALPIGGSSIAYRLLVEHRPASVSALVIPPAAVPEAGEAKGDEKVFARPRPGGGALGRAPEGPPDAPRAHWCAGCAGDALPPVASLLRVDWAKLRAGFGE